VNAGTACTAGPVQQTIDILFGASLKACESFVQSQKSLAWALSPMIYDDGDYSGGNMERPALTRQLDDMLIGPIEVAWFIS
jgi:hypothetical protein